MKKDDWIKGLKSEEFPEPYSTIAAKIGVENTIKIINLYQGTGVYFPKIESILNKIRNRKIRQEFNGENYRDLAKKYSLTERWIRDIVNENKLENQIGMFDKI